MTGSRCIRLGIPKGSLEAPTLALFERAGLRFNGANRSLWLGSSDSEVAPVLLKPQEIPTYVQSGRLDAGISGLDWIVEQDVTDSVALLAELQYSRHTPRPIRWVLAVPDPSPIRDVEELRAECEARAAQGAPFSIATELSRVSSMWLARHGIEAQVEFSWGATEAKASYFSDAIIEGTETGASLRANGLRLVAEVFCSTSQFFVNKEVYRSSIWKREKLHGIAHLITGALRANDLVQLTVVSNRRMDLAEVLGSASRVITSSGPAGETPFHAVVTLQRESVPRALPAVIAAGASDAWISPLSIYYSEASHDGCPPIRDSHLSWNPQGTAEADTILHEGSALGDGTHTAPVGEAEIPGSALPLRAPQVAGPHRRL